VKVEDPITTTFGGREVVLLGARVIIVLPCVITPPGVKVALPMTKPDLVKSAVTLDVPTTTTPGRGSVAVVKTALAPLDGVGVGVVLVVTPLMMIAEPDGAIEIRSPLTVASEPGFIVCEPTTKLELP